ncbi:Transcription-repair-coupling factor [Vibrio quintilis]|uniref:Transcription-repair-coupling factor n=1 Tax=Vibrio quintilis TaxID=1117707 RepID=A0A1M7Z1N3_9VIBR|nr:Transcription-repair-coupling factor [Vibrio quintilis]
MGEEQSGQIQSVGFTLYMEMLEQAVEALKSGKEPSLEDLLREQTEVEFRLPALLPDDYIPDINTRLSMYKQIASVTEESELSELKVELIDRFGKLPDAALNLLEITQFKLEAAKLSIKKIEAHQKGGYIDFHLNANIDPTCLVRLLQSQPRQFSMDGPTKLKFTLPLEERLQRLRFVQDMLKYFQENLLPQV